MSRFMIMVRLYSVLLFAFALMDAREGITSFVSDITVKRDATMRVQETIEVISNHKQILHGIVREFPTRYKDSLGNNYIVGFSVVSVMHNGYPANYWIEPADNGKKIYIGEKAIHLKPGKHTYTITYETSRQLGFFENHDELYWNVTGNGWRLPIDFAQARVHLPEGIPLESVGYEGYTGFQGQQKKNYNIVVENNTIVFSTTRELRNYEGLTIVVTFPKGFVVQPSWYKKVYWLLCDNVHLAILFLEIFLLLSLFIRGISIVSRCNAPGTIIPRFYPPAGFSPSECGFMKAREFENRFLSVDIVDLAVRGFITITYKKGNFFGAAYTLSLNDRSKIFAPGTAPHDSQLLSTLFSAGDTLTVSNANQPVIENAVSITKKFCTRHEGDLISELTDIMGIAGGVGLVLVMLLFIMASEHSAFSIAGLVIFIGVLIIMRIFFRFYTPAGRKLQDEIDGFELYLKTAEIERMKIIGTPPIRTPELYEHYLPYAMALGVEHEWTGQFSTVFEQLAQQGHPYQPRWYGGTHFRVSSFNSSLTRSFSSAMVSQSSGTIASSSKRPGSSSGSRGSGSSGGGGGGGGGGGW